MKDLEIKNSNLQSRYTNDLAGITRLVTYYCVTLKPYTGGVYGVLKTGLQAQLLRSLWTKICNVYADYLIDNEMHFETFKSGDLHAHGYLKLDVRGLTDTLIHELKHEAQSLIYSIIGKPSKVDLALSSHFKFSDDIDGWMIYINKQNFYDPFRYKGLVIHYDLDRSKCKKCKTYKVVCNCREFKCILGLLLKDKSCI